MQRNFVTPPFPGYTSGHSTFSRAAAEVMAAITGTPFFPGGLATFVAPQDEFGLVEQGPSATVELQWATYYDAADQAGVSRRLGGIHPYYDDYPSRITGALIGQKAWAKAQAFYAPEQGPGNADSPSPSAFSTAPSSQLSGASIGALVADAFAWRPPVAGSATRP